MLERKRQTSPLYTDHTFQRLKSFWREGVWAVHRQDFVNTCLVDKKKPKKKPQSVSGREPGPLYKQFHIILTKDFPANSNEI